MCGIAGSFWRNGDHSSERAVQNELAVQQMTAALRHRGPDGHGSYAEGPIALGHVRLSVIDVTGGAQPMSNEDGTLWLTFNGEIYNYLELRAQLTQKGHRFKTNSDSEVILHQYEESGEGCVESFNGQWAFALWDMRRQRLFVSRDRLGIRPLFYTVLGRQLLFASEAKALFTQPGVVREVDVKALDQIFTFWTPVAPRTIFKGVSELPAGHSLSVDRERVRSYCYWRPEYPASREPVNEDRCADEFLDLLADAIRLRLRSDVPVGAYLSGGLDSTVVACLVARDRTTPLRTFSVTFDDPAFDESEYQSHVVEQLRVDHSRVRCSSEAIAGAFSDVIWHTERPIVRTAPAPLYLLSRLVRDCGYKVVLTGEGADEVLGGYDIFKEAKIRAFWARQRDSVFRPLLLKRLYPYLSSLQSQANPYLQSFFRVDHGPEDCFFSHRPRWQLTARLKRLFATDVKEQLGTYDALAELSATLPGDFRQWDWFSRAQYLEAAVLLPGYLLSSQGDRMAMAHGVESRFPFLDHRVVSFGASLPPALKIKVLNEKYLLKKATRRLVPRVVRHRPKQPFRAPDASSFLVRDGGQNLAEYVETLLAPGQILTDGLFDPTAVEALVTKARTGRIVGMKDHMGFVGVLSTQLLLDRFIRSRRAA